MQSPRHDTIAAAVERMDQELDDHPADPAGLTAAVLGTVQLTRRLATIVDRLILAAPITLEPHGRDDLAADLLSDLRALRGCLVTGATLVDPIIDELQDLAGGSSPRPS